MEKVREAIFFPFFFFNPPWDVLDEPTYSSNGSTEPDHRGGERERGGGCCCGPGHVFVCFYFPLITLKRTESHSAFLLAPVS